MTDKEKIDELERRLKELEDWRQYAPVPAYHPYYIPPPMPYYQPPTYIPWQPPYVISTIW